MSMTVTPGQPAELAGAGGRTRAAWAPLAVQLVLLLGGFAVLYRNVVVKLVQDWANDGNYSHGFLIVPIALYLAWERRSQLLATPREPSNLGFLGILGSIGILVAGTLGSELFLTRVSIIGLVASAIVFLLGWRHLRLLMFPVAFLILMVPLPALIFNQIAFPLQLVASQFGEAALSSLSIPVLREGNVIVLAHTRLEVVEACSGIRSLVSLITLGIIYSYFIDNRMSVRLAIVLSTIPVAIVANGLRIAGTGIAAQYYGPAAAEGFFHEFSGWVVFVVAFAAIFAVRHLVVSTIHLVHRFRLGGATA
jgi:exosortase A